MTSLEEGDDSDYTVFPKVSSLTLDEWGDLVRKCCGVFFNGTVKRDSPILAAGLSLFSPPERGRNYLNNVPEKGHRQIGM
ncbi:MAG TPA: hypothetical protein VI758_13330 [Bacteroidota bacterium]